MGPSQTRARTRVPCISRQILNHCATREALSYSFLESLLSVSVPSCVPAWESSAGPPRASLCSADHLSPPPPVTHSTWACQAHSCLWASAPAVPSAGNTVPHHLMAWCLTSSKGLPAMPTCSKLLPAPIPNPLLPFSTFLLLLFSIALVILCTSFIMVCYLLSIV